MERTVPVHPNRPLGFATGVVLPSRELSLHRGVTAAGVELLIDVAGRSAENSIVRISHEIAYFPVKLNLTEVSYGLLIPHNYLR